MRGNRKFIFGFVIVGVGIALDRYLPGGLSNNVLDLIKFVSGGFFLGNGIEHITGAIRERGGDNSDGGETPDLSPVISQIEAVRQENAKTAAVLTTVQQALTFLVQRVQGK